jgi:hypothetical protein
MSYYNDDDPFPALVAIVAIAIIIVLLLLSACATLPADEADERHLIDAENLALCELAYSRNGPMLSNHDHPRGTHLSSSHKYYEVRDDLRLNGCRAVLAKYWIKYPDAIEPAIQQ